MDKPNRPVRNRRHSRKTWVSGEIHRPIKRLFTPEIKRMLKDWLVRRRENPYPSRDEKKSLAMETGLTYTQICNWFANWRRKLKNSGREPQKKTWGHLIKNYNSNAKGNVEQFSISSEDSIWGDDERNYINTPNSENFEFTNSRKSIKIHQYSNYSYDGSFDHINNLGIYHADYNNENPINNDVINNINSSEIFNRKYQEYIQRNSKEICSNDNINNIKYISDNVNVVQEYLKTAPEAIIDHCYTPKQKSIIDYQKEGVMQAQCFHISSTTDDYRIKPSQMDILKSRGLSFSTPKYKNHIMEKYLRGLNDMHKNPNCSTEGPQLSKWLESTANFTPNKNNYIDWSTTKSKSEKRKNRNDSNIINTSIHEKEELDAAEALTKLAGNFRNRVLNMATEIN